MTRPRPAPAAEVAKNNLKADGAEGWAYGKQIVTGSLGLARTAIKTGWHGYTGLLATGAEKVSQRPNALGAAILAGGITAVGLANDWDDAIVDGFRDIRAHHCEAVTESDPNKLMQIYCGVSSEALEQARMRASVEAALAELGLEQD